MIMYREDLDEWLTSCECSVCGGHDDGEPMCIGSNCHPDDSPSVAYGHGVIHVYCPICDTPVINIAVASRPDNGR